MSTSRATTTETPPLRLVAWEVTRSCVLSCRHCRAAASAGPYPGELTTRECEQVLDSLSSMGRPIVILTGGEPMLRDDIYRIARYGHDRGLRMVMATCGVFLDRITCARLMESGIARISLSIDGATARAHDDFRGVQGAFDKLMAGIESAKAVGLEFQVNTTITRRNLHELPEIFALSVKLGAVSFHPFLLVPTGRGKDIVDEMISPKEYERTLNWIYDQRARSPITLKPTCAPQYYRILRQREREAGRTVAPSTHGLDAMTRGCLGGQGFAFISHLGVVQICGFLDLPAGGLRASGFDFGSIWRDSDLFRNVRNVEAYDGKCGICEYRAVCGGCRARADAISGNYLGEEPSCLYQPRREVAGELVHA